MKITEGKPTDHHSDEELVELFRRTGNKEIIGLLFKRYTHLVLGVCYKYFDEREDARDVAMNVFESLFTSLHKYEILNFKAWLFTVTKSQCVQLLRNRKKEGTSIRWEENLLAEVMENSGFTHHNIADEEEERIRKLNQAIRKLSPGQQHCILLFYFDSKSYQQIAETTGLGLNEVKSHIQNGKRNLKNLLEQSIF